MKLSTKRLATAAAMSLALIGSVSVPLSPAEAGWRTGSWRHAPYGFHHGPGAGGAIAAGIIGALALGALAASAVPARGHAYPVSAHGAYDEGYGPECYTVARRFVDEWGQVIVRRRHVCE